MWIQWVRYSAPVLATILLGSAIPAQARDLPPLPADPRIAAALKDISPARIQADIDQLVSFGTRSTISAQDPAALAAKRGIGAAREWIKSQFEQYSRQCGGCLEVKTDAYTQMPAARIPAPTLITNVYAVLKGTDAEASRRIVLVAQIQPEQTRQTGRPDGMGYVTANLQCLL